MADTSRRVAGISFVTIDGVAYQLVGDPKWTVATVSRESLVGLDGVHGYKEMPRTGSMSCTLRDAGDLTVADFQDMTNSTVVFDLANGKTVSGRNMWTTEAVEVNSAEGTFEVKFEGPFVEEI